MLLAMIGVSRQFELQVFHSVSVAGPNGARGDTVGLQLVRRHVTAMGRCSCSRFLLDREGCSLQLFWTSVSVSGVARAWDVSV